VASLACGVQVNLGGALRILGSKGTVTVHSPWLPGLGGSPSVIRVEAYGAEPREHVVEPGADLYAIEADTVATSIAGRQASQMTWEDTLGNMATLDRWRAAIGLVYDMDTATATGGGPAGARAPGEA